MPEEVVPLESAFHRRGQQMCEGEERAVLALFITHEVLADWLPCVGHGTQCLDTNTSAIIPSLRELVLSLLGGMEKKGKSNVLL